jgi:hypothetical protein
VNGVLYYGVYIVVVLDHYFITGLEINGTGLVFFRFPNLRKHLGLFVIREWRCPSLNELVLGAEEVHIACNQVK